MRAQKQRSKNPPFELHSSIAAAWFLADGFYEWRAEDKGGPKTPYLFKLKNDHPFTFAGLYEHWSAPEGGELHTCTILTCPPNELVKDYHNRMPVMLGEETRWDWLKPEMNVSSLRELLVPYPADEMRCFAVSKAVNSPQNDQPEVVVPIGD
jgi:putative SOS response-associated peptidase YedK